MSPLSPKIKNRLRLEGQGLQVAGSVGQASVSRSLCAWIAQYCVCRLIALGAGFLGCCRPGRVGHGVAPSGPTPGGRLALRLGVCAELDWKHRACCWQGEHKLLLLGFLGWGGGWGETRHERSEGPDRLRPVTQGVQESSARRGAL
jgi:hypothetical protein